MRAAGANTRSAIVATRDSDLTGAARIRNAALRHFAARGVAATSIRDVAKAARVSPGLVQHHFPSKARLRSAVDDFVIRRALEAFGTPVSGGPPQEIALQLGSRIAEFIRANPDVFAYIGRSLLEADKPGLDLLEHLLVLAHAQLERLAGEGLLRSDLDFNWAALHVILIDIAAFLLEPALTRYLGEPLLSDAGLERMRKATTDLFLKGIYRSETSGRPPRRHR